MTEFAPAPQNMFATAWLINNAVTVEGVNAYIYWDLTWDAPGGLVTTENPYDRSKWTNDKGYVVRDPYYAVKHFARWVDTGWTRVAATASATIVKASAFVSPDGNQTTVVLLNTSGTTTYNIALDTGDWTYANSNVFRTSGSGNAAERTAELGPLPADGVISLPPLGIATVALTQ
jgi:O-glycosyl hydrolase